MLSPGFVRTELVDGLIATQRHRNPNARWPRFPWAAWQARTKWLRPGFLTSPAAAPLSGQVLAVDGGSSVYGGSQAATLAALGPAPASPLALQVEGPVPHEAVPEPVHTTGAAPYVACLDATVWRAPSGQRLQAVHAAAVRFAARYPERASLTLLLPHSSATDWLRVGDDAAARMLVATLACEWGAHALRINALEVAPGLPPAMLAPVVAFVAGAQAQYLTGQTLSLAHGAPA